MKLFPFQSNGVDRIEELFGKGNHGVLLADSMGLGKTIQALEVVNRAQPMHVLIVCPASLKTNWLRESHTWLNPRYSYETIYGWGCAAFTPGFPLVTIVNYDVLAKTNFKHCKFDLIIYDEAHYMKSPKAKRTKAAAKIVSKKRLLLTGTPILSRPKEIWQLLLLCGVAKPRDFQAFGLKYCAGYKEWIFIPGGNGRRKQVWNFDGASNLGELNDWLNKAVMVRRLKEDVLPDLPERTIQLIELSSTGMKARLSAEEFDVAASRLKHDQWLSFEEYSLVRHEEAMDKLPGVIKFIELALESSQKIVVFAHHRDVIDGINDAFDSAVTLYGGMKNEAKQASVDTFQNDLECRLFIGQIQAAGVGITLTAASHVIFAEMPWTPAEFDQAIDRCHRIGQKENVLAQVLAVENTLDVKISQAIIRKARIVNEAVNAPKQEN